MNQPSAADVVTGWTANNAGTTAIRPEHAFDEARLARWMEEHVEGYAGPLNVRQFKGGQSNPTFKLITPRRSYVMRRRPPGVLLKSAHAVDREYKVLSALYSTGFPVAQVFGLCENDTVLGSAFYVMDCVEGRIFWDTSFPEVTLEERPAFFRAMNETISSLHRLPPDQLGLSDFGRQGGYVARQIDRFTRQYRADVEAGRIAAMDRLIDWLTARIPADAQTSIIHGDFRADNMIFHPTEPRILAVIDWELSTLGDPLADFAFHAMMYRMPPSITTGLFGVDIEGMNIPSEDRYLAMYCENTGRSDIPNLDFYIVFNMFRLASIMHGIKGRLLRGNSASPHAAEAIKGLEPLAELAWHQAQRAA